MDRNELREACINAVINSGDPTSTADPTWSEAIDAVIRTVLTELADECHRREVQNMEAISSGRAKTVRVREWSRGRAAEASGIAEYIRYRLLPSTDSEAVRDGIR